MSVKIFYGEAGTGKTASMLEMIKRYAGEGRECILFVPEQFSFDAERQTYFSVGAGNIRHVQVTGFSKLSRSILKEYKQAKPVADNAVKLITMWLAVEKLKKDFLYFDQKSNSTAFCQLMLKTVAALRNGGISPEMLEQFLGTEKELDEELADKSNDILNIYTEYDRILTENLDDKLDDVSKAALIAQEHDWFNGKYLFFDNFDTFSEVQKKLLGTAVSQSRESVFCFTSDRPDSSKREFLCVGKTINEIKAIAPDCEEIKFDHCYRGDTRDKNPVEIYSAKDFYDEAKLITAKIHHMVREEGYRYRDFLVLTADSEHEPIISSALRTGGIPVFCDFPHAMTEKPVIGFIVQLFKSLELDTEEILKLAESGFKRIYDFDKPDRGVRLMFQSEIYRLRMAAEQYNLRADDWKKDWSEGAEPRKALNALEGIRKGIAEPLLKLKEDMEQAENGLEMSRVFMNYLFDTENIRSTFIARSKAGQGGETHSIEIDDNAAKEYDRIWDALTETLTSMAYSLKNVKLGSKEYGELLEEILSGINLANPPDVLDSVTVGDIERTRKSAPKIVFIAGVNEGSIPRESSLQSVFSYFEREKLCNTGLPLYDSNLNRWSKEYYFAYRAMNLYSKKLILTYAAQRPDGKETNPAEILKEIKAEKINTDSLSEDYFLNTVCDVKRAIADGYGRTEYTDGLENVLNEAIADREGTEFKAKLADSERLLSGKRVFGLSPDAAREILGTSSYSPTRLEAAFSCPLMYFFKYGLKIREPDSSDLEAPNNMGTAVHDILKIALTENRDIADKSEREIEEIAGAAVNKALRKAIENDPTFPEKTEAVYKGLMGRIQGILKQICLDFKATGFRPAYFEREVSYTIKNPALPEGEITVKGSADRIDLLTLRKGDGYEGGGENNEAKRQTATEADYIRICDYKSSGKSFTLDGIASGKNLQPLLYLFGTCESDKALIPAMVNYSAVGGVSCLKTENSLPPDQRSLAEEWYSKHGTAGGIIAPEAAERINVLKSAIAAQIGKKADKYMSENDISGVENLKGHIDEDIIVPKILDILNGDINAVPLEHEGYLPCPFCGFKAVCGNRNFNFVASEGMWEEKVGSSGGGRPS